MPTTVSCLGTAPDSPWPLVYLHVMKSGGLSVDAMLRCQCSSSNAPCALLREDGPAKLKRATNGTDLLSVFDGGLLYGSTRCGGGERCAAVLRADGGALVPSDRVVAPHHSATQPCRAQVLATHDPYLAVKQRPAWRDAAYVTLLREPVARVWSFYTYVRRKSAAFQALPLVELMRTWHERSANVTGYPPHWHWQLSNAMTYQFAAASERERGTRRDDAALAAAKASLDAMAVVGVTEGMAAFEAALAKRWPRAFGAAGSGCKVPSGSSAVNPTSVALKRWHVAPLEAEAAPESDAATRRAILGRNRLDAELYEHAKRLSSRS